METIIQIQKATTDQFDSVCQLLATENLPTVDINPLLENFFVAIDNNAISGVIGMDKYGQAGLLRSAIVRKDYRNTGVASALVNHLFEHAKSRGIQSLYLITNTAEEYFKKKGFEKISRNDVPAEVLQSKEFNGLCPASSAIMFCEL